MPPRVYTQRAETAGKQPTWQCFLPRAVRAAEDPPLLAITVALHSKHVKCLVI